MRMFGERSVDPLGDEKQRRRRLGFVLAIGTLGLLAIAVFGPYVEFAAYFWWLSSKLRSTGAAQSIAWAVALLLTPLLARSVRAALGSTWRGQTLRSLVVLAFPALLLVAWQFLSVAGDGPGLPRIRYEAPDLVVSHSAFGDVRVPLGRKPVIAFHLDSCTMSGPTVTCGMTVTNDSSEDRSLVLLVGDYAPPWRSQMFDDQGREYVAREAQIAGRIEQWSIIGYAGVPLAPHLPTSAAIGFADVASDAQVIRALRIAFDAGRNIERVEFRDVPIRRPKGITARLNASRR